MNDLIYQLWPWYIAGPIITFVFFMMHYIGNRFGVSSNFRTMCTIVGGDKFSDYFKFDWKKDIWNLNFLLGIMIGGIIASNWLVKNESVELNKATIQNLNSLGVNSFFNSYVPTEMFSNEALLDYKRVLFLILGGLLIGFGTRYAGGCTSGHAISGLSTLQKQSLVAVIGFFIGGLVMTWYILPYLFNWML